MLQNLMCRNAFILINFECCFFGIWKILTRTVFLILRNMRKHFTELSDACMLKKGLRSIYATASNALEARTAFRRWATLAITTGSRELIAMAKTIREKLRGIITYWTFERMSNASTEGFNNKIRWLMRQEYGFRGVFYLKLKRFQLPSIQPQKELRFMA